MKAILVIDEMPNQCIECPCYRQVRDDSFLLEYCNANEKRLTWQEVAEVPEWCPLKPLPQKKEVEVNEIEDIMHTEFSVEDIYTNKYIATIRLATDKLISLGWNACLEELEK